MDVIEKQIQWYEENSTSLYDEVVEIELKKINDLYARCCACMDDLFVNEMIGAFCNIIEKQRQRITDLETESAPVYQGEGDYPFGKTCGTYGYMPGNIGEKQSVMPLDGNFLDDRQLQAAFTQYCIDMGKSSYTVNDYCSRIKNLWKNFYGEYKNGELRSDLSEKVPEILWDGILLNVYENVDVIKDYVSEKIEKFEGNRNWANTRAAFNKFYSFVKDCRN